MRDQNQEVVHIPYLAKLIRLFMVGALIGQLGHWREDVKPDHSVLDKGHVEQVRQEILLVPVSLILAASRGR